MQVIGTTCSTSTRWATGTGHGSGQIQIQTCLDPLRQQLQVACRHIVVQIFSRFQHTEMPFVGHGQVYSRVEVL